MFISLGADLLGKIVLGLVAISLESTKVFSLLRIEYSMYLKAQKISTLPFPAASILIYVFLALLSIIASLGFTLVTVDKQVESSRVVFTTVSDDYEFEIEQKQSSLALIDSQIRALQKQIELINPDYATGSVKLSADAQKLADRRELLIEDISALKKKQRDAVVRTAQGEENNVYGMFVLMGNAIGGMPEKTVMFILLALISVLIEVSMIYTSPTIEIRSGEEHEVVRVASAASKRGVSVEVSRAEEPSVPVTNKRNKKAVAKKPGVVALTPFNPHIITEQIRLDQDKKETYNENAVKVFLQKLLTPIKGTELKSASTLADEIRLPVEKINEILVKIAQLKSNTNSPLLLRKDTAWHLTYMRDLTISNILKSDSMVAYLRGIINAS